MINSARKLQIDTMLIRKTNVKQILASLEIIRNKLKQLDQNLYLEVANSTRHEIT